MSREVDIIRALHGDPADHRLEDQLWAIEIISKPSSFSAPPNLPTSILSPCFFKGSSLSR